MLKGESITLRPVNEIDLGRLYQYHQDVGNRGSYFPLGVMGEPVFKQRFHETGFWQDTEGMLLIVSNEDEILGHIEYYQTVGYLDELELSYHIYTSEHSGKGVATGAVKLMTRYLFSWKKNNRIRLIIHPENDASKRVAEKCGYQHEGTARGAWFHQGRNHDVEVFAVVRNDFKEPE
ncbi:MAG: GNAT family protein [Anaerolineales bacterium]